MEFQQKGLNLDRFKFTIEETGIRIIRKRLSSSTETFIDFEDVGSKIIREKTRRIVWLIPSILFLIIAISVFVNRLNGGKVANGAEVFHICVSLVFLFIFFLTKKNILYLAQNDNSNAIEFIGTKRYKLEVEKFIENLISSRDKYLLTKFSTLDAFLPYNQQYNNLVWLYNLKLLSKEQLQFKIGELDRIDSVNSNQKKNELGRIIGFRGGDYDSDEGDVDPEE